MRRPARRPMIEALEGRELLTALLALTTDNALHTFDSSQPLIQLGPAIPVTGLQAGENLLAIDYRNSTGQLYGFGSSDRFYAIDPRTGVATAAGSALSIPVRGDEFDIYFNSDAGLQLVTDVGQQVLFDVSTGTATAEPDLTYAATDAGAGQVPDIVAAEQGVYIDRRRGEFVGFDHSSSPMLSSTFAIGFTPVGDVGLDQDAGHLGFISARPSATSDYNLYNQVNTALVKIASFPAGVAIRDLAVQVNLEYTARALTSDNRLVSFHTDNPGAILASVPITGTQVGETIAALSYRATTGVLYGFGTAGRLYTIDAATGVASAVSTTPVTPAYDGTKVSLTQLPDSDTFLVTTKGGQQILLDPSTGAVTGTGTDLMYTADDPDGAGQASVVSEAYTHAFLTIGLGTANYSSIFGIDSERDTVVFRAAPFANGMSFVRTDQPIGRDVTDDVSQDTVQTSATTSLNYLILTDAGATASTLYMYSPSPYVELANPLPLNPVADIGGGATIRDFAIAPVGTPSFSSATYAVSGDASSATITVNRVGGTTGTAQFAYLTNGGTAIPGSDYAAQSGVLTFEDGETTKTFTITIIPNSFTSGSRTLNLYVYPSTQTDQPSSMATLTINAAPVVPPIPPPTAGLTSATFVGTAPAITGVDLKFGGAIDPTRATAPGNYQVHLVTAGLHGVPVTITVASATYDATTDTSHLVFATPFSLRAFQSLSVTAIGFAAGGVNSTAGFDVIRGTTVKYLDTDGDQVTLRVLGGNARLDVLRPFGGGAVTVYVDGPGKIVIGALKPRAGSNRRATIARFVAGRAKLRLSGAITVGELDRA